MQREATPVWFNILFFSINLFIFSIPLYVGFAIYNAAGAEPFAVISLILYLTFLASRMTTVVKAIIKNESI
jgi:hypothetical protein